MTNIQFLNACFLIAVLCAIIIDPLLDMDLINEITLNLSRQVEEFTVYLNDKS